MVYLVYLYQDIVRKLFKDKLVIQKNVQLIHMSLYLKTVNTLTNKYSKYKKILKLYPPVKYPELSNYVLIDILLINLYLVPESLSPDYILLSKEKKSLIKDLLHSNNHIYMYLGIKPKKLEPENQRVNSHHKKKKNSKILLKIPKYIPNYPPVSPTLFMVVMISKKLLLVYCLEDPGKCCLIE